MISAQAAARESEGYMHGQELNVWLFDGRLMNMTIGATQLSYYFTKKVLTMYWEV